MATRKKKSSLPTRIYVKQETDPNDRTSEPYLVADESPDSMDDGETVGIYELKETRTMHVSRELK